MPKRLESHKQKFTLELLTILQVHGFALRFGLHLHLAISGQDGDPVQEQRPETNQHPPPRKSHLFWRGQFYRPVPFGGVIVNDSRDGKDTFVFTRN